MNYRTYEWEATPPDATLVELIMVRTICDFSHSGKETKDLKLEFDSRTMPCGECSEFIKKYIKK